MDLPVEQVVDLHQVDAVRVEQLERLFHLGDACGAARGPDLGGDEGLVARARGRQQIARHGFRPAVHRRAVDHRAARFKQRTQHLGKRRPFSRGVADVEGLPGAESDDAQHLARRRNLALVHDRSRLGRGPIGRHRTRQGETGREVKELRTPDLHGLEGHPVLAVPGHRSDGLAVQRDLGGCSESLQREIMREVAAAGLILLRRVRDQDLAQPWSILDAQQRELAVGTERLAVLGGELPGLRIGQGL